jgi:hypothetical protein
LHFDPESIFARLRALGAPVGSPVSFEPAVRGSQ